MNFIRNVPAFAGAFLIGLGSFTSGCSTNRSHFASTGERLSISEREFLTITNGSSLDEVRNQLGLADRHEFTVARQHNNWTLTCCLFGDGDNCLWLLFRDGSLVKVVEPLSFPEFSETYPYEGTTASRRRFYSIDDPVTARAAGKVIRAPAMTRRQMLDYLKPYNGEGMEPMNILPALVLAPIMAGPAALANARGQLENDYETNAMLLKKYDGCLATVGMRAEGVKRVYGEPLRTITTRDGGFAFIYGQNRELDVNPQLEFLGTAVLFNRAGRVSAVYSDGFFNEQWKE